MTETIHTMSTRPRMGSLVQSQALAKRKTRRCTRPYSKIRYWALTIHSCFTKFIIAMRYAKKIISIRFRCSGRMNTIPKSFTKPRRKCRRKVHSLKTRAALTHPLSTRSILSWNSIVKAQTQHGKSTNQVAAIQGVAVVWCPQIRPLKSVVYSQTRQITPLSLPSMLQQNHNSSSSPLAWTITNLRAFPRRHREFVGSQIFYKVPVPLK